MPPLRVTLACGPYDRTEALRTGIVRPEGIDLNYVAIQSPPEIFARMVANQALDASEMSCAHAPSRNGQRGCLFHAPPAFPARLFRHALVSANTTSGMRGTSLRHGRRV